MLSQEIMQPVWWLLFCHRRANAAKQSAWTASATGHHLTDNSNDRWKRFCLVG